MLMDFLSTAEIKGPSDRRGTRDLPTKTATRTRESGYGASSACA